MWKNVLQTITKDLPGFVEDGGWATVLGGSEDEGDDEDLPEGEREDSEFTPGESVNRILYLILKESDEDYSDEIGEEDEDDEEEDPSEDGGDGD